MATTVYASVAEVKAYLGLTSSSQDANLAIALEAACRGIDNYCGRRFWLDDAASPLVFTPEWYDLLKLPDIGSTTGLTILMDTASDGVYDTAWVADARTGYGYRLEPVNALAASESVEHGPYTQARALAGQFPIYPYSMQVTAQWGWPAVPGPIKDATLLWTSRVWKRKDAVLGVAGDQDVGFLELARRMDPDIKRAINPYRRVSVLGVGA